MKTNTSTTFFGIVFISIFLQGAPAQAGRDVSKGLTRNWKVYVVHQTHLDIGYTRPQEEVRQIQWQHLEDAMDLIDRTNHYPQGERFVWNPEATWTVSSWFQQAPEQQKTRFIEYVRQGRIGLSATFATLQTYLPRPVEYFNQFQPIREIEAEIGIRVKNGMYTDVPGWSWGTVAAFVENGIRYLSLGPNDADRIGNIIKEWGDVPHWWESPSGRQRILVFPHKLGYAWAHEWFTQHYLKEDCYPFPTKFHPTSYTGRWFVSYLKDLEESGYPYDSIIIRYAVGADNGPPDAYISSRIHRFNMENSKVELILSTVDGAFEAFEREHGNDLPVYRGDYSGYWEDGTYSSAKETTLARSVSEELESLGILNALQGSSVPRDVFWQGFREVLLYNEHTWGSHNSIRAPDSDLARRTWQWKAQRSANALHVTNEIRQQLTSNYRAHDDAEIARILVVNTHNRSVNQLVTIGNDRSRPGDRVVDSAGKPTDSQRLHNGGMAFLARLGPLEQKVYHIQEGSAFGEGADEWSVSKTGLSNGMISLEIDQRRGAIQSLRRISDDYEFVHQLGDELLAQHVYVPGRFGPNFNSKRNRDVRISVGDVGPLVSSIVVYSKPAGSHSQEMKIEVYRDSPRVDITFWLNKKKKRTKESVHYVFPLNVPGGSLFYDVQFGRVDLKHDMMPGGNRNYFAVNRFLELSNDNIQVTLVMRDAALVVPYELNVDAKAIGWKENFPEFNGRIYSYVMNNYWHTNFKADQEGPCRFRYVLWVGEKQDAAFSSKLAAEVSRPLIVVPLRNDATIPVQRESLRALMDVFSTNPNLEIAQISEENGTIEILAWNMSDQPQRAGSWDFDPFELRWIRWSV